MLTKINFFLHSFIEVKKINENFVARLELKYNVCYCLFICILNTWMISCMFLHELPLVSIYTQVKIFGTNL